MDWAVDFVSSVDREQIKLMRDTLDAKLKAESGQYGEAARILWELLVEIRHKKDRLRECVTMIHLAKVYRALRWSIATKLFEDALDMAESLEFTLAKMMALAELGEMKCQLGQFEESLEFFEKAMALVEDHDLPNRRMILLDTVVAYEGMDDLKKCLELLKEVIEIDKKISCDDIDEDLSHYKRLEEAMSIPQ